MMSSSSIKKDSTVAMSPPLLDVASAWTKPTRRVDSSAPAPTNLAPLPVRVIRSSRRTKSTAARIKNDHIEVRIPVWLSQEAEDEAVAALVSRLERRRQAAARPVSLPERAAELADEYDLPVPEKITWSDRQNSLWGSCTPLRGTIRISSRLAACPDWVLDFVILHELTHLVEANHGPAFQALLGRYPLAERAEGFLAAMSMGHADPRYQVG